MFTRVALSQLMLCTLSVNYPQTRKSCGFGTTVKMGHAIGTATLKRAQAAEKEALLAAAEYPAKVQLSTLFREVCTRLNLEPTACPLSVLLVELPESPACNVPDPKAQLAQRLLVPVG